MKIYDVHLSYFAIAELTDDFLKSAVSATSCTHLYNEINISVLEKRALEDDGWEIISHDVSFFI